MAELITYVELLEKIDSTECHLLLGNGFNYSLNVDTGYKEIFRRMMKISPYYIKLEELAVEVNYDIEGLIGILVDSLDRSNNLSDFLIDFLPNKIKLDFMKATYAIVKENIGKVYKKENQNIHLLFSRFNNYFTLNYDPFLYLLLLKFKESQNKAIATLNNTLFEEKELDEINYELLEIIRTAYNNGTITLNLNSSKEDNDDQVTYDMKKTTMTDFTNQAYKIVKAKNKKITHKAVRKVINILFDEIKSNRYLKINDGFQGEIFKENIEIEDDYQNLFFLHGAFHIYKNGNDIHKITKTSEKALHQILEEIIETEDKDIICVFKAKEKELEIKENSYLSKALAKLEMIEGEIVIFGSSLAENDSHIFTRINENAKITKVYISAYEGNIDGVSRKADEIFNQKSIEYFDHTTISYSKTSKETALKKVI